MPPADATSTTVATPRLDLVVPSARLVAALADHDPATAQRIAPFALDGTTFQDDDHVLALRHEQLTKDPAQEPWLLRAAVLRSTGVVIGRIGFHAPPDASGTVEVGYSVAPSYRRQGFATEMAVGLLRWGAEHGATACVASTRPDNAPSLAVIARLGFERTGEQMDEIDGLEWVFTLPLPR